MAGNRKSLPVGQRENREVQKRFCSLFGSNSSKPDVANISGSWVAKIWASLVITAAFSFPVEAIIHAQNPKAEVYAGDDPVPAATGTPVPIRLRTFQNIPPLVDVRAYRAAIRLNRTSSSGLGLRGSESDFKRFVRIELKNLGPQLCPGEIKAIYTVKEAGVSNQEIETVPITKQSSALIVDMGCFMDNAGTRVESSSDLYYTSATKYKLFFARFTTFEVLITSKSGEVIYHGTWPDPPKDVPAFRRNFTNLEGKKILGQLIQLAPEYVTLMVNGKSYQYSINLLSEEDRSYLKRLGDGSEWWLSP